MKPEAAPPSSPAPAEALWVRGELVRNMMRSAAPTQFVGMAAIPLVVAVLWRPAPPGLLAWAAFAVAVALARWYILRSYTRHTQAAGLREQMLFSERHRWLWPASGTVWGLMTGLHFGRVPLAIEFVCWLLFAAMAMFSIINLSSHLPAMRGYLAGMALPTVAIMAWRIGVDRGFAAPSYQYWLALLVLLYWALLLRTGTWLHRSHRHNFQLQFRNVQLIENLTQQTQAALDAVQVKNRFLASAAHDLRQPVHALALYADWLRSEPQLVHELAPRIFESTRAVNALFDSLFDLVRLDSGQVRLNLEPVDIHRLLRDLEVQYKPVALAKHLQLRLRLPATMPKVVSDPILLQRIVGNLLSNALRYTSTGGVLLAARQRAGQWRLEVWDTGVGIPAEYQREIFREFFKVPNHPGTDEGFGLGLSIVARLAHILGHPVSLASRPGRGTVFRLLLIPADPDKASRRAGSAQLANMP